MKNKQSQLYERDTTMKKAYFTVADLKKCIQNLDDDTEVFVANSHNFCGNISELAEVREDTYSSFGIVSKCLILDSAQNVTFDGD